MSSYKVAAVPQFYLGGDSDGPQVKILHLTDMHLHVTYKVSRLAALVNQINAEQPDLVVFTGDFLRWGTPMPQARAIGRILSRIRAPLGKFAVRGNHDLRGDGRQVVQMFEEGGFRFLYNQAVCIHIPWAGNAPFWVAGVDDAEFGLARIGFLRQLRQQPGFKLLLMHEPVVARFIPRGSADLALAGHTHGGQIHLPKVERFWMPNFTGELYHGFFHVKDATLYVSAGLGESALPVRLFCPPEMPLFHIQYPPLDAETGETTVDMNQIVQKSEYSMR